MYFQCLSETSIFGKCDTNVIECILKCPCISTLQAWVYPGKNKQKKKHFHFLQKDDEDKKGDGSDSSHGTFYRLVLQLA